MRQHVRCGRVASWKMQEGMGNLDDKLKEVGSTTKSRLDAAINDPEVAKDLAKQAAMARIEELKARAREPPAPRPQVCSPPAHATVASHKVASTCLAPRSAQSQLRICVMMRS